MDDFSQLKKWLNGFPFLTQADYDIHESFLVKKEIAADQIILSEGQICRELGFINYGAFRRYTSVEGKETNVQFFLENDVVGEYISFSEQKPSHYFIQSLEPSEIVPFDYELIQRGYQLSRNWETFTRVMVEEAEKHNEERIMSLLNMDGVDRYLNLLKTQPQIFQRISLYHIASYLGMERESLSRIRNKIFKHKWICKSPHIPSHFLRVYLSPDFIRS